MWTINSIKSLLCRILQILVSQKNDMNKNIWTTTKNLNDFRPMGIYFKNAIKVVGIFTYNTKEQLSFTIHFDNRYQWLKLFVHRKPLWTDRFYATCQVLNVLTAKQKTNKKNVNTQEQIISNCAVAWLECKNKTAKWDTKKNSRKCIRSLNVCLDDK